MLNCLIAVYTNEVKDYCDVDFFTNVYHVCGGKNVVVVDNSVNKAYTTKLKWILDDYPSFKLHRLNIAREPRKTLFHRNVAESVLYIRDIFLNGRYDYLFIIESDVFPPHNVVDRFEEVIKGLPEDWGILGGIYYKGFHNYNLTGVQKTHHVLSGCTLYKRELIEKYPFRYDPEDLKPFPDALICYDAGKEYSLWNDHETVCEHRHAKNGSRQSKPL